MRTQFYIQNGFLSKKQNRKELENLTNLNKFVQNELEFLNVATFNTCCDTAGTDPQPVRVNGETGTLETFNGTIWEAVDAGALVSDSITLDDGLVSALALRIGADTNNGLYGVSDTQLGIAVEGVLVGGANTTGLFTGNIDEQVAAAGVTVDGVLLKDGGVTAN